MKELPQVMLDLELQVYTQCAHCDHFVEINDDPNVDTYDLARYLHLDDGEKEHDHNAEPGRLSATLAMWRLFQPSLFEYDPVTDKIGPNIPKDPGGPT